MWRIEIIPVTILDWFIIMSKMIKNNTNNNDNNISITNAIPYSKVIGANMGPTWVLSAPDGPHVGPMNLAIRDNLHVKVKYANGNV